MSRANRLPLWLDLWKRKVRQRVLAAGIAALLACVLVITTIAAVLGFRVAYDAVRINSLRLLLLVCLLAIAWFLIRRPLQKLAIDPASSELEQRIPELKGELRTWVQERNQPKANPLLTLMASSILEKLEPHSPKDLISNKLLFTLRGAGVTCGILLLALMTASSANLKYGSQHFLLGWLLPDRLPPQSLAVTPGDTRVKRGTNLTLTASPVGFAPSDAVIYARFDTGDWQAVPMRDVADGFQFSFFGIHEALDYYVEAAGVRSQQHRIDVVDLASVQSLRVTYQFPEWTGLEPRVQETGTRIQGVEGTEVTLEIQTDMPLRQGQLLLNGEPFELSTEGNLATFSWTLEDRGEYFIADALGDDLIRLTDDYPVAVIEDTAPSIALRVPGSDRGATNIEEVPIEFEVRDDFRVNDLTLKLSVNAGPWIEVKLDSDGSNVSASHLLMLEEFRGGEGEFDEPLVPGDLVSYYLEAADQRQVVSSDMYFIDVQPFDKRYSRDEGGAGAGGAGGAGGGGEDEISQRQREILSATWNLQKQRDQSDDVDPEYLEDNAFMLSELQRTLAEQTQTTLERLDARRLLVDPDAQAFAENLELALEAMQPAAEHLQNTELDDSVAPQQKALQHLLRAEAQFRDILITMQQQNEGGGAGGGTSSERDLAQIYELEMDMERNQYETRQTPALQQPEQAIDEAFDALEELARRQEELAEQARRNNEMSLADRWQQEQLTRQAEELQEQLTQMQQQAGAQQSASQQAATEALQQNLEQIIEDMRNAAAQSSGAPGSQSSGESAQAASDQLRDTLDQLSEARRAGFEESVSNIADRARDLEQRQSAVADELSGALDRAMAERRSTGNYTSGLSDEDEQRLAGEKRDMAAEIAAIDSQLESLVGGFQSELPRSASALQDAADILDEERVGARLADAAESIEYGMAPQVAVREFVVSDALQRLRERAEVAADLAAMEIRRSPGEAAPNTAEQLANLRERLEANLQGTNGPADAQTGNQSGTQPGTAATAAAGGQNQNGTMGIGGTGAANGGTRGVATDFRFRSAVTAADLMDPDRVSRDASAIASGLLAMSNELIAAGISDQAIIEAQQLARQLSAENGDSERIADSLRALIGQLEKLELEVSGDARSGTLELRARSASSASDDEDSAEYFRGLNDLPVR